VASRAKIEEPFGSVLGIDGGKPPKTCFASRYAERGTQRGTWWVQREPLVSCHDIIIAEKPTGVIRANRTPASVVSPAGWGMAGMFACPLTPGGMRVWIPVEDWKRKLLGSAWNMRKESACRNFVEMFKLTGLDPENERDQDEIDAVAIAEAGGRFTRKELKAWQVKW
jgi:hypothetical protein